MPSISQPLQRNALDDPSIQIVQANDPFLIMIGRFRVQDGRDDRWEVSRFLRVMTPKLVAGAGALWEKRESTAHGHEVTNSIVLA